MNVSVSNKQKDLAVSSHQIKKLTNAVVSCEKKIFDEVAIFLISQQAICQMHKEFFNDPSPTDCLSFPLDGENEEGYRILGDVFVCPRTAIEYASLTKDDPYEELSLYIVHGLLHLMGYDDLKKEDRVYMRRAEKRHMKNLKMLELLLRPKK